MTDEAVKAVADRIEELERACSEWADASQANYQRAKTAEAKLAKAQDQIKAQAAEIERLRGDLAKAVEALRFYAWENEMRLPSEGPCDAIRTAIRKGGKDE